MSTDLVEFLRGYYSNFTNNMSNTLTGFSVRDYIRLIWIIGGYIFLRPYLDKGFKKLMESGSAKEQAEDNEDHEALSTDAGVKISANTLRGIREKVEGEQGEDGDSDVGESTGVSWGKSARRKQRKTIEYLEQELERKMEEEDDKDIADLLED